MSCGENAAAEEYKCGVFGKGREAVELRSKCWDSLHEGKYVSVTASTV